MLGMARCGGRGPLARPEIGAAANIKRSHSTQNLDRDPLPGGYFTHETTFSVICMSKCAIGHRCIMRADNSYAICRMLWCMAS
jgi:hypothetical protein